MSYDSIQVGSSSNVDRLIGCKAASKLASKDSSLFDFSQETAEFASKFMGWSTLCSNPPFPIEKIEEFARAARAEGLTDVLLVGQGGSTQASMTMAELLRAEGKLDIGFYTMDSMSSEYLDWVWSRVNPESSIVIVSSKSGSTLEPMSVFKCLWSRLCETLGEEAAGKRCVAITDPGSMLETMAGDMGFAAVFNGEATVGGRFSAMSVFGLVPFALMGIDLEPLVAACAKAEAACATDSPDNPALKLAAFMLDNHETGRNKACFALSPSCESFGLWLEQLIAESTGKDGKGILPNTENDVDVLQAGSSDRMCFAYTMSVDEGKADSYGHQLGSAQKAAAISEAGNPCIELAMDSSTDAACHMIVWEYAVSMYSAAAQINPFDQPDVESTKKAVKKMLGEGCAEAGAVAAEATRFAVELADGEVAGFDVSSALVGAGSVPTSFDDVLDMLLGSMKQGDFFCINAFVPYFDARRTDALERIRHGVAIKSGCAACMEIGPRYLHSIGQFQKGGYNSGVYLVLAAPESQEVQIPGAGYSLTHLGIVQAKGDYTALDDAGRRAVCVMLRDNSPQTIDWLAERVAALVPSQLS